MTKLFKPPKFLRWYFHRRTWAMKSGKVFLTFDDGPTPELTLRILEILASHGVKATFFCVGTNAAKHPELIQEIIDQGHAIGNHTMNHEKARSVSNESYVNSIEKASKHIESKLFRPPHGRLSSGQARRIARDYKIIMWSWLSYDFDKNVSVQKILSKARSQLDAGDVIVLHDNLKVEDRVLYLLPEIIRIVREKKLDFGLISA